MMIEDVLREQSITMSPGVDQERENAGLRENDRAKTSFESLLAHRESVFRICLGFSRNYVEAEDLAQEVYLKAYRNIGALKDPALSKEWLFRIAKNACLDRSKKTRIRAVRLRRWAESATQCDDSEAASPADDWLAGLKAAVRRLPKKLRSVFILRLYGHLTYDEIAATLGIARGTVMSRLNRARAKVAETIREGPR
ncbi:MAG: RNA polymerase sigma factor [Candidatus Aminicenantes bacterium]|nr:RNA polymerase sigma factor [Candidatus Aminicenantes bacterium]